MKPHHRRIVLALCAASALVLSGAALDTLADEGQAPPSPPPQDEPAAVPAAEELAPLAPATPPAEPERISGKLYKVDFEGKAITVLVEPEKGRSGRAFRRFKLVLDENSLILVDQQPSTISALESGQIVEVGFWKKGKQQVVDTVVVLGKDQY